MTPEEILNDRKNKFLQIGRNRGFVANPESLSASQVSRFNFQEIIKSKKSILIISGIVVALVAIFALML